MTRRSYGTFEKSVLSWDTVQTHADDNAPEFETTINWYDSRKYLPNHEIDCLVLCLCDSTVHRCRYTPDGSIFGDFSGFAFYSSNDPYVIEDRKGKPTFYNQDSKPVDFNDLIEDGVNIEALSEDTSFYEIIDAVAYWAPINLFEYSYELFDDFLSHSEIKSEAWLEDD